MINPIKKFLEWYQQVPQTDEKEPTWMSLATATKDGRPSVRIVLLKGIKDDSFHFFTNYESRKGRELFENPQAALCFYWNRGGAALQVRVEGKIEKVPESESSEYWNSRPRGSQLSGSVSPQSQVIANYESLHQKVSELDLKLKDQPIPRPQNWGGYCLIPRRIEFWTGKEHRLHEREVFTRDAKSDWQRELLAP